MWDVSGHASWTYDAAGRTAQEQRTIDGQAYTTASTFDGVDRLATVTLPDAEQLTYSYAGNGLLAALSSSLGTTLVSGVSYNALNQPKTWLLGGTSQVQQTYW